MLPSLSKVSNVRLVSKLKSLRDSENVTLANIVLCLSEIDFRQLYRDLGYSSLFTFCREGLGYSEGSAYRRAQAARALKTNPEIYELIKSGKISLCAISEIVKVEDKSAKKELLQTSEGKSKVEIQCMTAKYLPALPPKRDSIRVKVIENSKENLPDQNNPNSNQKETRFNFAMEVDGEFMRLYNEAKEFIGHVPAREVFKRVLSEFVGRRNKLKRTVKVAEPSNSRFIPKAVKIEVIERDKNQCAFVAKDGKRCSERHGLEIDHIKPHAVGGTNAKENLRLLCRTHNLLKAEEFFGKLEVEKYVSLKKRVRVNGRAGFLVKEFSPSYYST